MYKNTYCSLNAALPCRTVQQSQNGAVNQVPSAQHSYLQGLCGQEEPYCKSGFSPPRGGRTHNLWIKNTNSHTCCEAHMSMCRAEARMDVDTLRRTLRHNIWNMDERTLGKPKGSRTKESVSLAEHMFSHNALPGHIITMLNP